MVPPIAAFFVLIKPKAVIVKLFRQALLGQVLVLPAGFVFASRH